MHIDTRFDVDATPEACRRAFDEDDMLRELFPDTRTEVVESSSTRKTIVTEYSALGQQGEATFHFELDDDRAVRFAKVCNGRIWRKLAGQVRFEPKGSGTRVTIEMDGRTKGFVPEFTIRAPMGDQLEQMARALKRHLAGVER
jgi:carbon monoxide dehydrogenase subunit G